MTPLKKKKTKYIASKNFVIYAKKVFKIADDNKKYHKVRDYCHYTGKYRGAVHNTCNLRYKTLMEIPVVFHNGSTYDYHFIIKDLTEVFEGRFKCLRENTEKCTTFLNGKLITYTIMFIDSFRYMSSSLSNLVDNLSEGIHCDKFTDNPVFTILY